MRREDGYGRGWGRVGMVGVRVGRGRVGMVGSEGWKEEEVEKVLFN